MGNGGSKGGGSKSGGSGSHESKSGVSICGIDRKDIRSVIHVWKHKYFVS